MLTKLLLWLGICALPVYFWTSGGLQIAHYLFVAGFALFLIKKGIRLSGPEILLFVLTLYVLFRECISVLFGADLTVLLPFLYLAFSLVTFNLFRRWAARPENMPWLTWGFLIAAAIAIGGVLVKGYGFTVDAEGQRAIGTFNNPNQLGYFAVCIAAVAALLHIRNHIQRRALVLFFLGAIFLAVASLSKAAMISVAFAGLFIGFSISRSRGSFVVGCLVAIALVAIAVVAMNAGYLDSFKFLDRLRHIGSDSDDSLAGRGYGILLQVDALRLIFGFGSSGVEAVVGHEVHSTIASFFASYGVIGGALFFAFILLWFRRLYTANGWLAVITVAMPPTLYGFTHNGSRFTIFWILLGLSFVASGKLTNKHGSSSGVT